MNKTFKELKIYNESQCMENFQVWPSQAILAKIHTSISSILPWADHMASTQSTSHQTLYLKQEWVRIYPAHIVKVNIYSSPMTTAYMNIPQFRANTSFSLPPFQFTTVHLFDSCLILCRQALRVYWFVIPHYQQLTLSSVADQRHPLAVLHDK